MKFVTVIAGCVLLGGCVTNGATMLRNKDGQTFTCQGNWGFGLIGAPIAMASHSKCISDANKAGFYEIGKPIPAAEAKPQCVDVKLPPGYKLDGPLPPCPPKAADAK